MSDEKRDPSPGEDAPAASADAPPSNGASTPASKKPKSSKGPPSRKSSRPTPLDAFAAVENAWGYPAFAREFPRHDELDALVAAFARGDYLAVRERAPKLASSAEDERVKRAALLLRERVEPDPTARVLFAFAAALLAFLTIWWVTHDGPDGGHAPTPKPPPSARAN